MGFLITIFSIALFWIIVGCLSSKDELTRMIGVALGVVVFIVFVVGLSA